MSIQVITGEVLIVVSLALIILSVITWPGGDQLWLSFRVWLRWRLWRGKICPGTGERCKALNCNIATDNCYVTYAKWKEDNETKDKMTTGISDDSDGEAVTGPSPEALQKWVVSEDDSVYSDIPFERREDAIEEGVAIYEGRPFFIAQVERPPQPEDFFRAEDWLEQVSCQDDYMGDHAEDWDNSTKEDRDELTMEVQAVMAAWLDRHELRPTFWNAASAERIDPTA